MKVGCHTVLTVHAKDGTERDVAICEDDDAEKIGEMVIAAINGTRLFQLSTRVWPERERAMREVLERFVRRGM